MKLSFCFFLYDLSTIRGVNTFCGGKAIGISKSLRNSISEGCEYNCEKHTSFQADYFCIQMLAKAGDYIGQRKRNSYPFFNPTRSISLKTRKHKQQSNQIKASSNWRDSQSDLRPRVKKLSQIPPRPQSWWPDGEQHWEWSSLLHLIMNRRLCLCPLMCPAYHTNTAETESAIPREKEIISVSLSPSKKTMQCGAPGWLSL